MFYHNGIPVSKEKDLQLLFKFTWFATIFDVNAEVNNGRGAVDYKISMGNTDKTLVEFKLARNKKLKQNLLNQIKVYETANNTKQSLTVILFYTENEKQSVLRILEEVKTNLVKGSVQRMIQEYNKRRRLWVVIHMYMA